MPRNAARRHRRRRARAPRPRRSLRPLRGGASRAPPHQGARPGGVGNATALGCPPARQSGLPNADLGKCLARAPCAPMAPGYCWSGLRRLRARRGSGGGSAAPAARRTGAGDNRAERPVRPGARRRSGPIAPSTRPRRAYAAERKRAAALQRNAGGPNPHSGLYCDQPRS